MKLRTIGGPLRLANVVWRGTGDLDGALVELSDGPELTMPLFGRVTGSAELTCSGVGFPAALTFEEKADKPGAKIETIRESYRFVGTVRPGTGLKRGWYLLSLTEPVRAVEAGRSRWSGTSGAAVFCAGRLIAIVVQDADMRTGMQLWIVPVSAFFADPTFRTALGAEVRLESVEMSRFFARNERGPRTPATLLRPDAGVTGFRGREALLGELSEKWLARADPLSVRLVVGPGGQGKTRLARELCRHARELGWEADFVHGVPEALGAAITETVVPLLLVVDYAETRSEELGGLLVEAARRGDGPPVRFLLLARSEAEWWSRFRVEHAETEDVLLAAQVTELGLLAPSADDQDKEFASARAEFAAALNLPDPVTPPRALPAGSTALAVHLAALSEVLRASETSGDRSADVRPEEIVLGHERRYWKQAAADRGLKLRHGAMDRVVAAVTLFGAADKSAAHRVLDAVPDLARAKKRRREVREFLRHFYPSSENYWGTLQPDKLGEYLIAREAAADRDFVPELMDAVIEDDGAEQITHAMRVLVAVAADHEQQAADLVDLIAARPRALAGPAARLAPTVANPAPLVDAITRMINDPSTSLADLSGLEDLTPKSQVLGPLTLAYSARALREAGEHSDQLPSLLGVHFLSQFVLGRLDEAMRTMTALRATSANIGIAWERARNDLLVASGQAVMLLAKGLPQQAREAIEQALAANSEVIADNDWGPLVKAFIGCLYAAALIGCDEYERAVLVSNEVLQAMERLRDVAMDESDRWWWHQMQVPQVAVTHVMLGLAMDSIGNKTEALTHVKQAIDMLTPLVQDQPDLFTREYAYAFMNHAMLLAEDGKYDEAVPQLDTAVDLQRSLIPSTSDLARFPLLMVLLKRAELFARRGETDRATADIRESLDIIGQLPGNLQRGMVEIAAEAFIVISWFVDGTNDALVALGERVVVLGAELAAELPPDVAAIRGTTAHVHVLLSKLVHDESLGQLLAEYVRRWRDGELTWERIELGRMRQIAHEQRAYADCVDLARAAVEKSEHGAQRAEALHMLWGALYAAELMAEAESAISAAIEELADSDDTAPNHDLAMAVAHAARARTWTALDRPVDDRIREMRSGLAVFEQAGIRSPQFVQALDEYVDLLWKKSDWAEIAVAARTLKELTGPGVRYQRALVCEVRALSRLGRYEEVLAEAEPALTALRADHSLPSATAAFVYLTEHRMEALYELGRFEEIDRWIDSARADLAVAEGDEFGIEATADALAKALRRKGELREVLQCMEIVHRCRRTRAGWEVNLVAGLLWAAEVAELVGEFDRSEALAAEALTTARRSGLSDRDALRALYFARNSLGDARTAIMVADELRTRYTEDPEWLRAIDVWLACHHLRIGEPKQAAKVVRRSLDLASPPSEFALGRYGSARGLKAAVTGKRLTPEKLLGKIRSVWPDARPPMIANAIVYYVDSLCTFARDDTVVDHLRLAERLLAEAEPSVTGVDVAVGIVARGFSIGCLTEPLAQARRAVAMAETLSDPCALALAQDIYVWILYWLGHADTERQIEVNIAVASAVPEETKMRRERLRAALVYRAAYRVDRAMIDEGMADVEAAWSMFPPLWRTDDPTQGNRADLLSVRARCHYHRGDFAAAREDAETVLAMTRPYVGVSPRIREVRMARTLTTIAVVQSEVGDDYRAAATEAAALWKRAEGRGLAVPPSDAAMVAELLDRHR
ncbi:ATP-binding protein [Nocardia bovistercoris]|uniref:ATP-binding protein n=1 Tax=Nocardia bovistercoris TaxID=2785916 RepID=A0A931N871_9NOCA|nr:ATP-binding protein [Nocardia bovistercoris]MBH0781478.1 ATP-binding protein [Nocardia bovistercoris]